MSSVSDKGPERINRVTGSPKDSSADQHATIGSPDSTSEPSAMSFLPVTWHGSGVSKQATIARAVLVDALTSAGSIASFSFFVRASNGTIDAGFLVPDASPEVLQTFQASAAAIDPTSGLGLPEPWVSTTSSEHWHLEVVEGMPGRDVINLLSPAWEFARQSGGDVWMRVDVMSAVDASAEFLTSIRFGGDPDLAEHVANLSCIDVPGSKHLVPRRAHEGMGVVSLPLSMLAHLISTPARVPNAWPEINADSGVEVLTSLANTTPPHLAVFGGSGLGKTTLLEHLVMESIDDDHTVVVLDPHGDLAERASRLVNPPNIDGLGRSTLLDFGSVDGPTWNLCRPPKGVEPGEWVVDLTRSVRSAWADMPEEFFGPVGMKALRVALAVLVLDPAGPWPLTEAASVLTNPSSWEDSLERIGQADLTADHEAIVKAIDGDRTQHMSIWVTSKLEPFVNDPRITRVIGTLDDLAAIDEVGAGRSLFCSTPSVSLGDAGANVVNSAILSQLWTRVRRFGSAKPIDVFVDEVHRLPPSLLAEILQEGRKFGVRLRAATQSPLQVDPALQSAMLNNSGGVATFRCGPDASALLAGFFIETSAAQLRRLPNHHVAIARGATDTIGAAPAPLSGD